MHQTRLCLLATLLGCVAAAPARAAEVYGYGSITTNVDDPELVQIDTEYDDPELLDVRKIVELSAEEIGGSSTKLLDYLGQALFGRLRVRSLSGRLVYTAPELSTGVDIQMEFGDEIMPMGLDPLTARALRLDVDLDGAMQRLGITSGNYTNARFGITMLDLDFVHFACLTFLEFTWSGDVRDTTNESGCVGNPTAPRFVPLPGEEPRFEPAPTGGWRFRTRGHLDVPLDDEALEGLALGDPFQLRVTATATSSCSAEPCRSFTDFYEVTVGNARIVDANGDPVVGASFDTESGWDYGAPPDPLPAPEPASLASQAVALTLLGRLARRRRARAIAMSAATPASVDAPAVGSGTGSGSAAISTT